MKVIFRTAEQIKHGQCISVNSGTGFRCANLLSGVKATVTNDFHGLKVGICGQHQEDHIIFQRANYKR